MTQAFNKDHIGSRVQYRSRNDTTQLGTVRDVVGKFVDVDLDGSKRDKFFVPFDMLTLIPKDLE